MFVTPQLGQKRRIRFMRGTELSRGSYSNASAFFIRLCRVRLTSGSKDDVKIWQKSLGSERVVKSPVLDFL